MFIGVVTIALYNIPSDKLKQLYGKTVENHILNGTTQELLDWAMASMAILTSPEARLNRPTDPQTHRPGRSSCDVRGRTNCWGNATRAWRIWELWGCPRHREPWLILSNRTYHHLNGDEKLGLHGIWSGFSFRRMIHGKLYCLGVLFHWVDTKTGSCRCLSAWSQ